MRRRSYIVAGAVSVAVGVVLLYATTPFWWIGGGMVAAGVALGLRASREGEGEVFGRLREPREVWGYEFTVAELVAEVVCLGILAGVTVAMLQEVAPGDRPVSHDHTVHFFKAWQLENHFLAEGRLHGWSHQWFGGYPAHYLYPIGADLLVVGIHALTLGLADFGQAYAWAICLFWFLGGYACYRFGAVLMARWAGVFAAFLFMTDTAAYRSGGWNFAVEWGVWPMSLSVVLAVWAMARVPRLMEGDEWRDVAAFGCLMAASLVSHPFMLIHFAFALTVAVLAFWLADTEVHWLVGSGRLALGGATGTLLAMVWVLPFLASSAYMDTNFGGRWTNVYDLGQGLYNLDLLPGTWGVATAFAVAGLAALLWSRQFGHLLVGLLGVVFLVTGSTDFLAAFNFLDVFPMFQTVHFKRFVALLKPYWMIAAAYGVFCIVRWSAERSIRVWSEGSVSAAPTGSVVQRGARLWVQVFLAGFVATPLLVPFAEKFVRKHLVRKVQTASERPDRRARERLGRWFEERHSDGEPFFRVAIDDSRHVHRLVDLGTRIPHPIYKVGYTPATSFEFRPEVGRPDFYEAFNVRYLVTRRAPSGRNFSLVERFGSLAVYEYDDWRREPFEVVEGEGPVELKEFGSEEIVLEAGEGAEGQLRLNVSNFSRWHAYREGREIPIAETRIAGNPATGMMTVELAPGTYRFVFESGWAEWGGWLLFVLGAILAVGFAVIDLEFDRSRAVRERLERVVGRVRRWCRNRAPRLDAAGLVLVAGGFGLFVWMAWHSPELRLEGSSLAEDTRAVRYDFGHRLREAAVEVGENPGRVCRELFGYFLCGTAPWTTVHQRMEDFGTDLPMARCIWAHPRRNPLRIYFPDVPAGDAVVGYYGVPESGNASAAKPVDFQVGVGGVYEYRGRATVGSKLYTFRTPIEEDAGGTVDVAFRVSAENAGKRHFCFNAQVVDLVEGAPASSAERDSGR